MEGLARPPLLLLLQQGDEDKGTLGERKEDTALGGLVGSSEDERESSGGPADGIFCRREFRARHSLSVHSRAVHLPLGREGTASEGKTLRGDTGHARVCSASYRDAESYISRKQPAS